MDSKKRLAIRRAVPGPRRALFATQRGLFCPNHEQKICSSYSRATSKRTVTLAFGETLMKKRWLLEAAGVSLLLLLPYFSPFVIPGGIARYHHDLDMSVLVMGILLDLIVFFLVGVV